MCGSRDSIAGVMPRLPVGRPGIRIPLGQEIFLFSTTSRLALAPILPPVQCVPAFLAPNKVATEWYLQGAENDLAVVFTLFMCAFEWKERQSIFFLLRRNPAFEVLSDIYVPFRYINITKFIITLIINPLKPNDHYSGRTAPLTSKRCILYIYSTNIGTEYFKHAIYSPFFHLQNAVCFIILTHLVLVLFTFYIQVC